MKTKFLILLLSIITAVLVSSCSNGHESLFNKPTHEITLKIPVFEQESVANYTIQALVNGNYTDVQTFKASLNQEDVYYQVVDIYPYFGKNDYVWLRIVATDIDKKTTTTPEYRFLKE